MAGLIYLSVLLALISTLVQGTRSTVNNTTELVNTSGTITHWFTQGYKNEVDLTWRLDVPTLMDFTLLINRLWLEESNTCKADKLIIHHGETLQNILGPFCGRLAEGDNITNNFSDYGLSVHFRTDTSVTLYGFEITYTSYITDTQQICEMMHNNDLKVISTAVLGRAGRYPLDLNCTWDIHSLGGGYVSIHVEYFDIEFSGRDCIYDSLEIWEMSDDETDHAHKRLGRFCGRLYPWTVFVSSYTARVLFISDRADNFFGFVITYSEYARESFHEIYLEPIQVTPSPLSEIFPPAGVLFGNLVTVISHIRTLPGFYIQADFNDTLSDQSLIIFDGPDRTFPAMDDIHGKKQIFSNGFHMVFQRGVSNVTESTIWEVTFRALEAFARESTNLNYVETGYGISKYQVHPYCVYQKVIGPPLQRLKILELNIRQPLEHSPNTDDCAYFGIALFDGELTFNEMIGPFCDVFPQYMKTLLKNFVSSSSTVYVVQYDYTNTMSSRWVYGDITFISSTCRGYEISKLMFTGEVSIEEETFSLSSTMQNNTVFVSIDYVERLNECLVVTVLPFETKGIHKLQIQSFSDNVRYRVCRKYGLAQYLSESGTFLTKFEMKERCGELYHTNHSEIILEEEIAGKATWNTEYIRVELGRINENLCRLIDTCPESADRLYLSNGCGIMKYWKPSCYWVLLSQAENQIGSHWLLEVAAISGSTLPPYGFLGIQEFIVPLNGGSLHTHLFPHQLGFRRILIYRTVTALTVVIRPLHLIRVDLNFRMITKDSKVQRNTDNYDECYRFNGHCYTFIPLEQMTSWEEARNHCHSMEAYMVSINTISELQFIKESLTTVWREEFYGQNYGMIFIGLSDVNKADHYRWVDGSPLTVSDWYYSFDAFNNILPVEPKPVMDTEKIQPVYDTRLRCVAMNVGNPFFSSNWAKINCQTKHPSATNVICEYSKTLPNETWNEEVWGNHPMDDKYECPDGWNYVQNSCLAILTGAAQIGLSIEVEEATRLCKFHGGKLAVLDKFSREEVRDYIMSRGLRFGNGDIWVKYNPSRVGCISLSLSEDSRRYNQQIIANTSETCVAIDGHIPHVMCERDSIVKQEKCLSHLFTCDDGTCLSPDTICNRQPDCTGGEDEDNCMTLHGIYSCGNGQIVSISKYCDFQSDCYDGSDENVCIHPDCFGSDYRCINGQCIPKELRCDHKIDCVDGSDEESCDWGLRCQGFACPAVGCLPISRFQDLQPDCPDASQADEDRTIGNHKRYLYFVEEKGEMKWRINFDNECPGNIDHQRCHPDHAKCFPRHKACIYDHDQYGDLRYCRNGAHLRYCDTFECPSMFKCPKSYCIPLNKVCNGIIDCIDGADESNCTSRICPGKYRCGNTFQCISLEELCDGKKNCQSGWMDEIFCDLESFNCPNNCNCFGYSISCRGIYRVPYIRISSNIRVFDLDRNQLVLNTSTFEEFSYLSILVLSNNKLDKVSLHLFSNLSNLIYLDLRHNMLTTLKRGIFNGLNNLRTLELVGNPVSFVQKGTFDGLLSLPQLNLSGMMIDELKDYVFLGLSQIYKLDLSNNGMREIKLDAFTSIPRLELLLLEGNPLDKTAPETFHSLNVETMRTDSYRFCCFAGENVKDCLPDVNVYSSCSDLLANEFVQIVVWMFGILAALGNASVIVWRLMVKINNAQSVFVLHLGISDTLMAIYLICLASIDTSYRGTYILHDKKWRDSGLCQVIGVIATISCEMSIFILLCIATDRTKRLLYPFGTAQFTTTKAWLTVMTGWSCSLAIAVVPIIIPSYFGNYYGRNAICLPFNFAEPTGNGWEFATVVFVGLNSISLSLIIALYVKLYCGVKESQTKAGRDDRGDLEVARRLSLVIMTNVVCFIPIIIANISAILGQPVNRDIASVLTTVVLPVNSAINPYLFTFSACRSKKPKRKATPNLAITGASTTQRHLEMIPRNRFQ